MFTLWWLSVSGDLCHSSVDQNVNQVSIKGWLMHGIDWHSTLDDSSTHYPYFYSLHCCCLINNSFCIIAVVYDICPSSGSVKVIMHWATCMLTSALNSKPGGILGHNLNKADYLNWPINSERTSGVILILSMMIIILLCEAHGHFLTYFDLLEFLVSNLQLYIMMKT